MPSHPGARVARPLGDQPVPRHRQRLAHQVIEAASSREGVRSSSARVVEGLHRLAAGRRSDGVVGPRWTPPSLLLVLLAASSARPAWNARRVLVATFAVGAAKERPRKETISLRSTPRLPPSFELVEGPARRAEPTPGPTREERAYWMRSLFKGETPRCRSSAAQRPRRTPSQLRAARRSGGNVLLYDEPTNDLDVDTIESLGDEALRDCVRLALVVVSTERHRRRPSCWRRTSPRPRRQRVSRRSMRPSRSIVQRISRASSSSASSTIGRWRDPFPFFRPALRGKVRLGPQFTASLFFGARRRHAPGAMPLRNRPPKLASVGAAAAPVSLTLVSAAPPFRSVLRTFARHLLRAAKMAPADHRLCAQAAAAASAAAATVALVRRRRCRLVRRRRRRTTRRLDPPRQAEALMALQEGRRPRQIDSDNRHSA